MLKFKIIAIFVLVTGAALVFQNCGKHNPATIEGTNVATLGDEYVGKTYELYRMVHSDGSEHFYNKDSKPDLVVSIFIRFESPFEIFGNDGCNTFTEDVLWSPPAGPDELPEVEFFNLRGTTHACQSLTTGVFAPKGKYFYDVKEDLFRLIRQDSSVMYEYTELVDLN